MEAAGVGIRQRVDGAQVIDSMIGQNPQKRHKRQSGVHGGYTAMIERRLLCSGGEPHASVLAGSPATKPLRRLLGTSLSTLLGRA